MKKACTVLALCLVSISLLAKDTTDKVASMFMTPDMLTLQPEGEFESFVLTVTGPDGQIYRQSFSGLHMATFEPFDANGNVLADGSYTFELVATPILSDDIKKIMREARTTGDYSQVRALEADGLIPNRNDLVRSGYLTIRNGYLVTSDEKEPKLASSLQASSGRNPGDSPGNPTGGGDSGSDTQTSRNDDPARDQQILDDLIVDGSICVGQDCVNGESFGFDTIRMKENNLRIRAFDTSNSASFPTNDWQLTFNDSSNGGANKFSVDDIDGGRTPFTIEASAPSHSLYVDDGGRIGVGTATPVVEIHVPDGDTPTLRLEQDGTSGFTPQTWDVAGNEANFFVRDVTNGSALPFKIIPGADSDSLRIEANNDVTVKKLGVGITPRATTHIAGQLFITEAGDTATNPGTSFLSVRGDSARIFIDDTNTTNSTIPMTIRKNGRVNFNLVDNTNSAVADWSFAVDATTGFLINRAASPGNELTIDNNGDAVFGGELTADGMLLTSDRNAKKGFQSVDSLDVLNKVLNMPITTWQFKEREGVQHMGPMAQDFFNAFGLGSSDTQINVTDSAGVAFGAIQGLNQVIEAKDQKINDLEAKLAAQEARLKALEDALLNQ